MLKKRICALLLTLLLTLSGLSALAAGQSTLLRHGVEENTGYEYIFTDGETLYLHGLFGLSVWRPGDAKQTYYPYEVPDRDYSYVTIPFCADGALYAVRAHPKDDSDELDGATLCRVILTDGKAAFEEIEALDWEEMVYDRQEMFFIPNPVSVQSVGDRAFLLYDFTDKNGAPESHLAMIDLERERSKMLDVEDGIQQIAPYKDEGLLMLIREPGEETAELRVYDPRENDSERLTRIEVESKDTLSGLAYDADADAIYVAVGSQLHVVDAQAREPGDRVLELPAQADRKNDACMLSDGLYAYCDGDVAVLNLKEKDEEQISLVICDPNENSPLDGAIKHFQLLHPSAQLRVDRDKQRVENLVESLVNQDDSVDIYLLDSTLSVYDSLRQRSFMLPMDDSKLISDSVGSFYPAVREAVTVKGRIMALPVDAAVTTVGVGTLPLEALGVDAGSIPDNWSDFLDMLAGLKEPLKNADGIRLTYDYKTAQVLRTQLFNAIFRDYEAYRLSANGTVGYNTDLLRGLLEKLDRLDFVEMGMAESEDEAGSNDYSLAIELENKQVVLDPAMNCAFDNLIMNVFKPHLMGLDAEHPGALVMKLTVAIINPYSKNAQAATSFMESMLESMPNNIRYTLTPGLNTPIRGEIYENVLREYDENIWSLQHQLEKAEGAARMLIQQKLDTQEEDRAYTLENEWEISQRCIDWFRKSAENLSVAPPSWLDAEARAMMTAYCKGELSPGEMLERIDKMVRMMQLEGN